MNAVKSYFKYIYLCIVILQLVGIYWFLDLRIITKPLIMISLGAYYFWFCKDFKVTFFIALVLAFLGDLFLMWEGQMFFVFGLSSFLVMQLLYSWVFLQDRVLLTRQDLIGALVIIILGGLLVWQIVPNVKGVLVFPVIIYSLSIMAMVLSALFRRKTGNLYIGILAGACLFLVSDSFLAYNMFVKSIADGDLLVMGTYMAAQYLIVTRVAELPPVKP